MGDGKRHLGKPDRDRRAALAAGLGLTAALGLGALALGGAAAPLQASDDISSTPFLTSPLDGDGAKGLSPDQVATITRLETYLNELSTVRSRFVQISSQGTFAEGELYLQRPGRVRFQYDDPHPVLLIADGHSFLYYDRELKNATFIPLEDSPLWFLIQERVSLTDEIDIVSIVEQDATITLSVRSQEADDQGEVTLVFADQPIELRKWVMTDLEGRSIQVALVQPQFEVPIDRAVFEYGDLDVYGLKRGPRR